MSRSQNKSALAGFSLVEVVLGIFIFSLLVTAFVGAVIYGLEAVSLMGRQAQAALIADGFSPMAPLARDKSIY